MLAPHTIASTYRAMNRFCTRLWKSPKDTLNETGESTMPVLLIFDHCRQRLSCQRPRRPQEQLRTDRSMSVAVESLRPMVLLRRPRCRVTVQVFHYPPRKSKQPHRKQLLVAGGPTSRIARSSRTSSKGARPKRLSVILRLKSRKMIRTIWQQHIKRLASSPSRSRSKSTKHLATGHRHHTSGLAAVLGE